MDFNLILEIFNSFVNSSATLELVKLNVPKETLKRK